MTNVSENICVQRRCAGNYLEACFAIRFVSLKDTELAQCIIPHNMVPRPNCDTPSIIIAVTVFNQ
jgi:hypothetical protein